MREIKFRAWLTKSKIMLDWEGMQQDWSEEWYCHPLVIPMQYTGLKDNSGREIYEGDILFHSGAKGQYIGVVSWREDLAAFYYRYGKNKNGKLDVAYRPDVDGLFLGANLAILHPMNSTVVIGNIYENPELLK